MNTAPRHARGRTDALAILADLTITMLERIEDLEHRLDVERHRGVPGLGTSIVAGEDFQEEAA